MIERIYIPTIRRPNNQVTYDNLPKAWQEKVIMVVEPGERESYDYPCGFLELPEEIVGSWTQLAETRKLIHLHAGDIKYAMVDDDCQLVTRNSKYWSAQSNMEKSKRTSTEEEINRLFDSASKWLDEENMGVVGISSGDDFPRPQEYIDTIGVFTWLFLDGKKISPIAQDLTTEFRVAEDLAFMFHCLSSGVNTRKSNEFLFLNRSQTKEFEGKRPIWEETIKDKSETNIFQSEEHYDILRGIQKLWPIAIDIFEKDGKKKNRKNWSKIYTPKCANTLEDFMS